MPAAFALVFAESMSKGVGALIPRPCSGSLFGEKRLEPSGKDARAKMRRSRQTIGKPKNTPGILAYKCGVGLVLLVSVKWKGWKVGKLESLKGLTF